MPTAPPSIEVRPDRGEGFAPLAAGPAPPRVPQVKLWPFALEEVTPGDRRATSPVLRGPAIIDTLFVNAQNDNTNPKPSITLWYGPTLPPSGNAVIPPGPGLGTPVFTDHVISSETANIFQGPIQHLVKISGDVLTLQVVFPLRFPIMLDTFQVMIQMGTQTAGSEMMAGYLRILEAVPPELFPNFL